MASARRLLTATLLLLLSACPGLRAEQESRYEQRSRYQQALQLLERGQRSRFRELAAGLHDYPLQPYLQYAELLRYRNRMTRQEVERFRREFPDTPLADQLLQNYLYQLVERRDWHGFVELDNPDLPSRMLACRRPIAWYEAGKREEALELISALWLVGRSQPKACDPAFKLWRRQQRLTDELVWQRLRLSLQQRQYSLADYLDELLSDDLQPLSRQYRQLMRWPAGLMPSLHELQSRLDLSAEDEIRTGQLRQVILDPLYRLARSDPLQALDIWHRLHRDAFGEEEILALQRHLQLRLLRRGDPDGRLHELKAGLLPGDTELGEASIRFALAQNRLEQLPELMDALPEEAREQPRWRYWLARALLAEVGTEAEVRGRLVMQRLAEERDYYGFLAADFLGTDYRLHERKPDTDTDWARRQPGIERALELYLLGELTNARREWLHAIRDAGKEELLAAASLADAWGWHERAIRTLTLAGELDLLEIRFPLTYMDEITHLAHYNDLPVTLALAITHRESAFMPDIRSSADALGLMQVTRGTANEVARSLGMHQPNKKDLLVPATNIRLGTAYLGQMLRRFSGNRVLAAAAYNAGPGRVDEWLRELPLLPLEAWIEVIPISETRGYVQKVLYANVIYSHRVGRPTALMAPAETRYFAARAAPPRPGIGPAASSVPASQD